MSVSSDSFGSAVVIIIIIPKSLSFDIIYSMCILPEQSKNVFRPVIRKHDQQETDGYQYYAGELHAVKLYVVYGYINR